MHNHEEQFQKVWATLEKMSEEHRQALAQSRQRQAEYQKEQDERHRKLDEKLDKIAERFGGFTHNIATALENEFAEAMREKMEIGGKPIDKVLQNVHIHHEFDLVGINGKSVVVGEIKHKLRFSDVEEFVEERLPYFAEECSLIAQGKEIFGMVGGAIITDNAEKEAKARGLLVVCLKNKKLIVKNATHARPI